ncbi:hypothetical protein Dvina_51785 [Dactylosporangium vinaceum]|uniref:N-acetyltransferase domain-containing protein n=1 Tax=Dactylosporangium vinaceum TaxID=53362 RepID=A0ABV5M2M1_9ACTN|nr:hypothetical protein [Dactylosporangium vinaceum]UAB96321.1 hypothetical protein Dvina_51785 [Dactylosporangium vinaceum]
MNVPQICTALPGEAELVGYTILAATAGHPLRQWLLGDATEYQLRADITAVARHAIACGAVDWCDDRSAVAVWLQQPAAGGWPPLGASGGFAPDTAYIHRITTLAATLPPVGRPGEPQATAGDAFWQLLLVAVEPGIRRIGRASALLAHRHAADDRAGAAATAYAFDEPTVRLLERHGYRPAQQAVVAGAHPCWIMLRPPRAGARTGSAPA